MIQICWKLQALCIRDVTRFYGDSSPYENEMDEENKSENSTKKRTYGLDEGRVANYVTNTFKHKVLKDKKHTQDKLVKATCFGTVKFTGFGRIASTNARYVRLHHETKMKDITKLLLDYWNMPRPKIIVSIPGEVEKELETDDRLNTCFKQWLMHAVTHSGAWIITEGTNSGVMALVGEAVREHRVKTGAPEHDVVVLGIASWDAVDNKESLEPKQDENPGLFPAIYNKKALSSKKEPLNHNHTHFLLVDEENKKNGVNTFRAKLEQHFSEKEEVPVVMVVLEGGKNVLATVAKAARYGIPLVVIKNSGQAADALALAKEKFELAKEKVKESSGGNMTDQEENIKRELQENIKNKCSDLESINKCVDCIWNIMKKRQDLVTVFEYRSVDGPEEFDNALLRAIIKANPNKGLTYAMDLNGCDVAYERIQQVDHSDMTKALVEDKPDFVQFFLDSGLELEKVITPPQLLSLYEKVIKNKSSGSCAELLLSIIGEMKWDEKVKGEKNVVKLDLVVDVVDSLLSKQYFSYEALRKTESDRKRLIIELFIWALLFNRHELAKLFWKLTEDHIGGALMAYHLLKSLAEKANRKHESDLYKDLNGHAEKFQDLACCVANGCYYLDKEKSHQLLVRKLNTWDSTPLAIAHAATAREFFGTPCCETKLTQIWVGKMPGDKKPESSFRCSCTNDKGRERVTTMRYTSPQYKFWIHVFFFVLFLALYSYFVLTSLRPLSQPNTPPVVEIILSVWVLSMIFEEMRQIWNEKAKNTWRKIRGYMSLWNVFDSVTHMIFVVAVILRSTVADRLFEWPRMAYCFALSLYFIRILQAFDASHHIGPKVIMIREMITDIWFFLCILGVFMASYGIPSYALRFPNGPQSFMGLTLPYWQMYGELALDEVAGDVGECSFNQSVYANSDVAACAEKSYMALGLYAIYMLMTNVVLLNLLVAMFTNTVNSVHENSETVWSFHRYSLVSDYDDKPWFPPPIIFISFIYRIGKALVSLCIDPKDKDTNALCETFEKSVYSELTAFEAAGMAAGMCEKRSDAECPEQMEHCGSLLERLDQQRDSLIEAKRMFDEQKKDLKAIKEQLEICVEKLYSIPKIETDGNFDL